MHVVGLPGPCFRRLKLERVENHTYISTANSCRKTPKRNNTLSHRLLRFLWCVRNRRNTLRSFREIPSFKGSILTVWAHSFVCAARIHALQKDGRHHDLKEEHKAGRLQTGRECLLFQQAVPRGHLGICSLSRSVSYWPKRKMQTYGNLPSQEVFQLETAPTSFLCLWPCRRNEVKERKSEEDSERIEQTILLVAHEPNAASVFKSLCVDERE